MQDDPGRPVFNGNGPDDYVCVQCGNVLAEDGGDLHDPGGCGCAALAARRSTWPWSIRAIRGSSSGERGQQRPLLAVGGRAVLVRRGDPDHRRVAHCRGRQVAQRIVIGPLALDSSKTETLGR